MTPETLPDHYRQLIEAARAAGGYPAHKDANGQIWCDVMVGMGLMTKRGVFKLDDSKKHVDHAKTWNELHVYDATSAGRRLIGQPYPSELLDLEQKTESYRDDGAFGKF